MWLRANSSMWNGNEWIFKQKVTHSIPVICESISLKSLTVTIISLLSFPAWLLALHRYRPLSLVVTRLKIRFWFLITRPSLVHVTTGSGTPLAWHFKSRSSPVLKVMFLCSGLVILGGSVEIYFKYYQKWWKFLLTYRMSYDWKHSLVMPN